MDVIRETKTRCTAAAVSAKIDNLVSCVHVLLLFYLNERRRIHNSEVLYRERSFDVLSRRKQSQDYVMRWGTENNLPLSSFAKDVKWHIHSQSIEVKNGSGMMFRRTNIAQVPKIHYWWLQNMFLMHSRIQRPGLRRNNAKEITVFVS